MKRLLVFPLLLSMLVLGQPAAGEEKPLRDQARVRIELAQPFAIELGLEERLEAKGIFQADRVPLSAFATALEQVLGTSVMLIPRPREQPHMFTGGRIPLKPEFDAQMPLTVKLKNVRVRTALKLILEERGLTYFVDDNVLLITTLTDAWERIERRVYDVRPLMAMSSPIKKTTHRRVTVSNSDTLAVVTEVVSPDEIGPDGNYNIDDLVDVIRKCIEPDTWDEVGGAGTMVEFKGFVMVGQTADIHAKVENFLNMLHEAGGIKEKVKVSR